MRYYFIILGAITLLLASSLAVQARSLELLVVIHSTNGVKGAPDKRSSSFLPSMRILVLERRGQIALVRDFDDLNRIGWVSIAALASPESFKPVDVWHGQSAVGNSSEDDDAGTIYYLHSNGAYNSIWTASDSSSEIDWRGKLFRNGQVIWAKPQGSSMSRFRSGDFFWLKADGSLCKLNGAKCIGE